MWRRSPANPAGSLPRRRPSLDFSVTGLIYVSMMLFLGLAAINSQANLLFAVFGLMIGILIVSGFVSRWVLKRLEVRRHLPESLSVGTPATVQYEFTNNKRYWPSFSVTISELSGAEAFTKQPQAYLLHVAAGMTASVPTLLVPRRRGVYHFDRFQLHTSFPFGFIKRAIDRRLADGIVIHPAVAEVDAKLLSLCLSAEQSGARMKPRRGGTDEFYGIKEYRQGENPRWIYWKRSAKTGTLVSKEMTQVAPPRLMLLLDTYIDRDGRTLDNHADLERTISMAASLITRTIDQGLAVGLYTWSGDWLTVLPSRGKQHARELLSLLAKVVLNTTHPRADLVANAHKLLRSGTTAVLLTPSASEAGVDPSRPNWLTLSAKNPQSLAWFRFPGTIDFTQCIPHDQQP